MLKRSFATKDRVSKVTKSSSKRSFGDRVRVKVQPRNPMESPPTDNTLMSSIITLAVGPTRRLFACHEDVLLLSPFFAACLKGGHWVESTTKQVELPDEEPEVFSSVLEYLYKGDYYPRLLLDKRRDIWTLEDAFTKQNNGRGSESTVYHNGVGGAILKDTAIYCTAEKFGLDELKRIALRKQGLQTGIQIEVILRSARFAYENTPEQDAKLRAHFLALIIRSRKAFKRSGTMQMEMELGGSRLFFDLFVAMANHIDDIVDMANVSSPKSI